MRRAMECVFEQLESCDDSEHDSKSSVLDNCEDGEKRVLKICTYNDAYTVECGEHSRVERNI